MREIKFRAWGRFGDEKEERMIGNWQNTDYVEYVGFDGGGFYVLMQYTGLKDKNGKEIYEGDFVLVKPNMVGSSIGKIRWSEKSYRFLFNDGTNWELGDIPPTSTHTMEIIGNVYENPELLNKEEG